MYPSHNIIAKPHARYERSMEESIHEAITFDIVSVIHLVLKFRRVDGQTKALSQFAVQ